MKLTKTKLTNPDYCCDICGREAHIAKTGRMYCPDWAIHREEGDNEDIGTKADYKFNKSLPEW